MQVTIIGSGNVATVIGRLLFNNGHKIHQVFSRNEQNAATLAKSLHASYTSNLLSIDNSSDLYLIAITDDAMKLVCSSLFLHDKWVIHTAGAVSMEILKNTSSNYGVLWPMKMIRKSMDTLLPITWVIDGNSDFMIKEINTLALGLSPNVINADDTIRLKMHVAATITSNFTNHVLQVAADYCLNEKIDFQLFLPMIEEIVKQMQYDHPKNLQAGPAFRGDLKTIEKHSKLLLAYPEVNDLYLYMSNRIMHYVKKGTAE